MEVLPLAEGRLVQPAPMAHLRERGGRGRVQPRASENAVGAAGGDAGAAGDDRG